MFFKYVYTHTNHVTRRYSSCARYLLGRTRQRTFLFVWRSATSHFACDLYRKRKHSTTRDTHKLTHTW